MINALGVIGLGTMGANLARNAARNGAHVVVFNRTTSKTDEFLKAHESEGAFTAAPTLAAMVQALPSPRAILLMVKAGEAVDSMLQELSPLLTAGDILLDAGNSHYRDTERREAELQSKGIRYIGLGVSGGEKGALQGPSMMPGGDASAYRELEPLLKKMAAQDGDNGKCIAYMGPGGAGHFVKMVHNGIEYGIMQLLAEAYAVLKTVGGRSNDDLASLFGKWNDSDLSSFLLEITAKIFAKRDEGQQAYLLDAIKDVGGQKGTGKWTTLAAAEYTVSIPSIAAAVDARLLSALYEARVRHSETYPEELSEVGTPQDLDEIVHGALAAATCSTYWQGFDLLQAASLAEGWKLDLAEIARIWRGGCIIRSVMLEDFQRAYSGVDSEDGKAHLLQWFSGGRQLSWRQLVATATGHAVPVPAFAASLSYYDAIRAKRLPQNLIQAQRDFFGAHTFERIDKQGAFHTEWE